MLKECLVSETEDLEIISLSNVNNNTLIDELNNAINKATIIIADITPDYQSEIIAKKSGGFKLGWNPNVFYELGRAHQRSIPTFIICDSRFSHDKISPPFDIATHPIEAYEFSYDGLRNLSKKFLIWYAQQDSNIYHKTLPFLKTNKEIHEILLEWKS